MITTEYRTQVARAMAERELQTNVEQLARRLGYLYYHTHDSRRSAAGFPDLVLVGGSRLIMAELKSVRGRVSAEQQQWLEALAYVHAAHPEAVEVHVWRPADWLDGTIQRVLQGGTA